MTTVRLRADRRPFLEIIMVRMQGDFGKPPEKRLNYKNSIDGLVRVSPPARPPARPLRSKAHVGSGKDGPRGGRVVARARRRPQRLPRDSDEREPARFVSADTPPGTARRSAEIDAWWGSSYDFFKDQLLQTGFFADNIYLHTSASFIAVSPPVTCAVAPVLTWLRRARSPRRSARPRTS